MHERLSSFITFGTRNCQRHYWFSWSSCCPTHGSDWGSLNETSDDPPERSKLVEIPMATLQNCFKSHLAACTVSRAERCRLLPHLTQTSGLVQALLSCLSCCSDCRCCPLYLASNLNAMNCVQEVWAFRKRGTYRVRSLGQSQTPCRCRWTLLRSP